ncbi:MAG: cytochrome C oxidase subunit IV family protein [Gemmatimonadota bacterium]|nr:cytochrome C oxidase subunit IV family protein [Gemmatimonadota bacterium]MDH3368037.1 cytochrome C oxidase subunit IV family protein [Gemmatimonadota bacterium]MDH3477449.1 cytochrome C oxidase subunit IV family protein [Gemmatimonadota bacterium]MDH3570702.1 cytochrome C oxidase subunit IV family protein [Gemmatimonadota bacterium]MDH5551581.1 cytochrome C oxidase subunit IV family protein [Gemmatimonadota bacterium]
MSDQPAHSDHKHPSVGTYLTVAGVLTVITLVEVGVFYVPAFARVLAPVLLTLSAAKFVLVVMFYMHLKGDHRFFKLFFTLPLVIAVVVAVALLLLFGTVSGSPS